jgi:2-iminobutanoate/2-iminopropanoate deaminase
MIKHTIVMALVPSHRRATIGGIVQLSRDSKEDAMAQTRQIVQTNNAPGAVGPYSQAIVANGVVYCAGQIPVVPGVGSLVEGDIRIQASQALKNLSAVLEAAGSGLDLVVKTTVFLKDLNDFTQMNEVYGSFFTTQPPARSTVQVARLPLDALVEVECIALVRG